MAVMDGRLYRRAHCWTACPSLAKNEESILTASADINYSGVYFVRREIHTVVMGCFSDGGALTPSVPIDLVPVQVAKKKQQKNASEERCNFNKPHRDSVATRLAGLVYRSFVTAENAENYAAIRRADLISNFNSKPGLTMLNVGVLGTLKCLSNAGEMPALPNLSFEQQLPFQQYRNKLNLEFSGKDIGEASVEIAPSPVR